MPNREDAWQLLCEYTKSESLRRHALAVEAVMRRSAERYGQANGDAEPDAEMWGITGLLHDFDYELYPSADEHPYKGAEIMRAHGYPELMIEAILGHATYTGVARRTRLAQTLFAVDELCGFLVACALVRPTKNLDNLEVSSVKKKLKDKAFARTVSRDDVQQGAAELGVPLDDHIRFVVETLQSVQKEIGLIQ